MTKEEILHTFSDINYYYNNSTKHDTLKRMLDELSGIQLKIGKWQCVLRGDWIYEQCSSCGSIQDARSNYCPVCGAKMEESEDGENI